MMQRETGRWARGAAAAALGLMWVGGCVEGANEFREAATPMLRTGVDALLDGLVEGMFAVFEPDGDGGDTTDASGSGQ